MLNTNNFYRIKFHLINSAFLGLLLTTKIWAQSPANSERNESADGSSWWFVIMFVLILSFIGAIFWRAVNKNAVEKAKIENKTLNRREKTTNADKELEWLRKNQKLVGKNGSQFAKQNYKSNLSADKNLYGNDAESARKDAAQNGANVASASLPIFSIENYRPASPFEMLPLSNDGELLNAVEQVNDEFEEDEEVRDLSVRILAAFKTRNSVESLAQVALYDLSSNLRSRAVTILSEFDHESVFETILLASADPTREVRAAAARGLSRLSFDRADAWARIVETGEEGRIVQAARAAIEGGFVERTFSRLVHGDHKFAYEGFVLLNLLIKAGETDPIFNALEKHSDMNVRRAILHVIKVMKNPKVLDGLYSLLEQKNLLPEMRKEIDKAIEEIGFVTA